MLHYNIHITFIIENTILHVYIIILFTYLQKRSSYRVGLSVFSSSLFLFYTLLRIFYIAVTCSFQITI